jgi:hypothetical protein
MVAAIAFLTKPDRTPDTRWTADLFLEFVLPPAS